MITMDGVTAEDLQIDTNPYIRPGKYGITRKQRLFLMMNHVPEILFGGAAGGGKSWCSLAGALQYVHVPRYSALLLRRTFPELSQPGGMLERAHEMLGGTDARWSGDRHAYVFPSGASLSFGYLETDKDRFRYLGSEFQYIGLDEATKFTETQLRYMHSRMRRVHGIDVPLRMRLTTNPGGPSHDFIKQRFMVEKSPDRLFIPSKLSDNPYLDQAEYTKSLDQLDPITRAQLLNGDWSARQPGGMFKREDFGILEEMPGGIVKTVRFWDLAASESVTAKRTAGLLMAKYIVDGEPYYLIVNVVKGKWAPGKRDGIIHNVAKSDGSNVKVLIEQEPGSGGIAQIDSLKRMLAGFWVEGVKATGDRSKDEDAKRLRAGPVSTASTIGKIKMLRGEFNASLWDELEAFPEGGYKDQVDSLSGAYLALVSGTFHAPAKIHGSENKVYEAAEEKKDDDMDDARDGMKAGRRVFKLFEDRV